MKNNNIEQDENRLIESRKANLESLRNLGINPYPSKFQKTHTTLDAREMLEDLELNKQDENPKTESVIVAGRIMAYRDQGKIIFIDLKDGYGSIQIAFRSDLLTEKLFGILKFIDIGDDTVIGWLTPDEVAKAIEIVSGYQGQTMTGVTGEKYIKDTFKKYSIK